MKVVKKNKKKLNINYIGLFQVMLGIYLMSFAFHFIFQSNHLVTGGVGGLGLIIQEKFQISYVSYFIFAANFVLLFIGYFLLGKKFFLKSLITSIVYPLIIFLFECIKIDGKTLYEYFISSFLRKGQMQPTVSEYVLSAILGSILSGIGLGLVFNAGATTGGTDIVQKILNKYAKIPMSIAIYLTDGIIVLLGFIVFSKEAVLYSLIAVILIGYVVDRFTVFGKRGYTAFIVTQKVSLMKEEIIKKLDRGFTKIDVKGGFTENGKTMLICTVGKREVYLLKEIIKKTDTDSFSFFVETTEVVGMGFERKE